MSSEWTFDPLQDRDIIEFAEFEQAEPGASVVKAIEATPLGSRIISFIRGVNPAIGIDDLPMFGVYIPYEHNLEPWRTNDINIYDEDVPLILIDRETLEDKTYLPYILTGLFFRCLQDKLEEEDRRIVPMFQHSIVYNPVVCLGDKRHFTKEYIAMERACDAVALSVAYQMSRMDLNKSTFGTLLQQQHTGEICKWIGQTGAFIERSGMGHKDPGMAEDLLLYMANMGGLQSPQYNKDVGAAAERTFSETVNNVGFKQLEMQPGSGLSPFNSFQFSLLSPTYQRRDWDPNDWVIAINNFLAEEQKDRAFRITEAFRMAAENRKDEWLNGGPEPKNPAQDAPKAKGPKPPKK